MESRNKTHSKKDHCIFFIMQKMKNIWEKGRKRRCRIRVWYKEHRNKSTMSISSKKRCRTQCSRKKQMKNSKRSNPNTTALRICRRSMCKTTMADINKFNIINFDEMKSIIIIIKSDQFYRRVFDMNSLFFEHFWCCSRLSELNV
jgi:hypothetical protein